MKHRWSLLIVALLMVLIVAVLAPRVAASDEVDPDVAKGRALVADFGNQLKAELKEALGEGGPVAAIAACKERAPQIASALSRSSGVKLRRTSLRYRNPLNAPEPWEADVLRAFEDEQLESPEAPLEYVVRLDDGAIRYMSAIKTGPVCLVCHGDRLADAIDDQLRADYPHDRARGYALGDIRGAFSLTWSTADADSQ
jgi:hypothetical protein